MALSGKLSFVRSTRISVAFVPESQSACVPPSVLMELPMNSLASRHTKNHNNFGLFLCGLLTSMAICLSGAAVAQTASPAVDKGCDRAAGPECAKNAQVPKPEATKVAMTQTTVRQVPRSVVLLPKSLLQEQGSLGVREAIANSASTTGNAAFSTPSFDASRVRGFAADTWVDGHKTYGGDRESLINVERIEISKGPMSLMSGGGYGTPVGGIVHLISKTPTPEAATSAGLTVGSLGMIKPFFDINKPLSETVLFRMTGEHTQREFDVEGLDSESYNLNPTLQIRDHDSKLTVRGKISRWEQKDYQGLPATGTLLGNIKLDSDLFLGPADLPESYSQVKSLSAKLEHQIDRQWSVDATAGISATVLDQKAQNIVGGDGVDAHLPVFSSDTWRLSNRHVYTEQLAQWVAANLHHEFESEGAKHKLVFGTDYNHLVDDGFNQSSVLLTTVDLTAPVFQPWTEPGTAIVAPYNKTIIRGTYGQLQSEFGDRLHVLGGLRLAHVDMTNYSTVLPDQVTTDSRLLPQAGIAYDMTEWLTSFVSYSQGMQAVPGVFYSGTPQPELSRQIEGGFKFETAQGLSGSIAAYQIGRTHVAVPDTVTPGNFFIPEGEQRARGIDVDATWQVDDNWSLLASYNHNRTISLNTVGGLTAGNEVPGVADQKARLWAHYTLDGRHAGWSVGGGFTASSGVYIDNANLYKTDGLVTLDAKVAYETDRYTASLNLKNLLNEREWERYDYLGGRVKRSEGFGAYFTLAADF